MAARYRWPDARGACATRTRLRSGHSNSPTSVVSHLGSPRFRFNYEYCTLAGMRLYHKRCHLEVQRWGSWFPTNVHEVHHTIAS